MRSCFLLCGLLLIAAGSVVRAAEEAASAPQAAAAANATSAAAGKKRAVPKKAAAGKSAKPAGPAAKELFGAVKAPAPMAARSIGFYAKGCLAGASALPVDGPTWQAMRLSRNRNWGHPDLVALVEKRSEERRVGETWG